MADGGEAEVEYAFLHRGFSDTSYAVATALWIFLTLSPRAAIGALPRATKKIRRSNCLNAFDALDARRAQRSKRTRVRKFAGVLYARAFGVTPGAPKTLSFVFEGWLPRFRRRRRGQRPEPNG